MARPKLHSKQPAAERRTATPKKLLRIAGLPAVSALFAAAPERVERLFFDARMKRHVAAFCTELARSRKPYREVGAEEIERVAGSVMHGGIVALAAPRAIAVLDPAAQAGTLAGWARSRRLILLLDGVGNPHNLGAIARSAAFLGVERMILSDHPAQAGPSDASYRVAEGGLEHLELWRAPLFARMLAELRKHFLVVGAAAEGGRSLRALEPGERPVALVLGNEEHGLPPATLKACEQIVTIPGAGRIQSLNVAASAAILLYGLTDKIG
jgi:RNA methyltransferase, TrmH family